MDSKPTMGEIELIEKYYGIVFPASYKEFLLQYGGGYFAHTVVYSLDKQSSFYVKNNITTEFIKDKNIFPVIDFETGDVAGFKIDKGICEDSIIIYLHEENAICDLHMNFYDALVKYGLNLE